ncbi:protein ABIL1-like isoform X2 [Impatiens glandulifera]|uniref:protein ABIL1-like isoform X2 n=1 Tax=Impatiens glandulifera TaxID=253017 RepID=UPI001FB12F64|nr:protein ABIL1-like isoform X2 [Impatiens glandulifera]
MKPDHPWPVLPSMTYDEEYMDHNKNFVKALQELKNLKPQLYSAAEYCEKSYIHNDQKQMVLGNLKDYAVRALVTAVDHLGTVAFKLNDLLDQQTSNVSAMELDVSFLNQRFMTCQIYTDKEGMRQQQLFSIIPRHHKHYVLPNAINKKVHFSPQTQSTDTRESSNGQSRSRILCPSGTPASKTLSWHLATETKSTLEGTRRVSVGNGDTNTSGQISGVFDLSRDDEKNIQTKASISPTIDVSGKDSAVEGSKKLNALKSFDKTKKREAANPLIRSKSVLSALFSKQKASRIRTIS